MLNNDFDNAINEVFLATKNPALVVKVIIAHLLIKEAEENIIGFRNLSWHDEIAQDQLGVFLNQIAVVNKVANHTIDRIFAEILSNSQEFVLEEELFIVEEAARTCKTVEERALNFLFDRSSPFSLGRKH